MPYGKRLPYGAQTLALLEAYVWLDSICINQNNLSERGQQVGFMRQIYSAASRVIVWLGEWKDARFGDDDSLRDEPRESCSGPVSMQDEEFRALIDALEGPEAWWRRVWVYQECAAARYITVMAGKSVISWEKFWRSVRHDMYSESKVTDPAESARFESGFEAISGINSLKGYKEGVFLTYALCMTSKAYSSDPLDKIYALLGLVFPDIANEFKVDYCISPETLFLQVLCIIIKREHSLDILVSGWPILHSLGLSWMPDFSAAAQKKSSLLEYKCDNAGLDPTRFCVSLRDGVNADLLQHVQSTDSELSFASMTAAPTLRLSIRAASVGNVLDVKQPDDQGLGSLDEAFESVCKVIDTACQRLLEHDQWPVRPLPDRFERDYLYYTSVERVIIAINSVLQRGKWRSSWRAKRRPNLRHETPLLWLRNTLSRDSDTLKELEGRSVLITSWGSIGVGIGAIHRGDQIVIPFGASVPFILRSNDDEYTLVGAACMNRMMQSDLMNPFYEFPNGTEVEVRDYILK